MANMSPRCTGIFVPIEILQIKDLSFFDTLLLSWIDALYCPNHGGCYASNKCLANYLKEAKENSVAKSITKLRKMGLVEDVNFDGRVRIIRATIGKYIDKVQSKADLDKNPRQTEPIQGRLGKKSNPELDICPNPQYIDRIEYKDIAQSRAKPGHEPHTDLFFCTDSNSFQKISQKDKDSWSEAYPEINVSSEISKAVQWLLANPSKAKKKLWRKFLVGWFTRANEKAENKKAYRSQFQANDGNSDSAENHEMHKKCESNKKFAIDLLSKVIFNDPDEQNIRVCDKYVEITDKKWKTRNQPYAYTEKGFREFILKTLKRWGKIDSEQ